MLDARYPHIVLVLPEAAPGLMGGGRGGFINYGHNLNITCILNINVFPQNTNLYLFVTGYLETAVARRKP